MTAESQALQRQLDAVSLAVAQRVADVYWRLWLARRLRAVHEQHLMVLHGLSETVLARLAVGQATLAQVQQIALASARTEDMLRAFDEDERTLSALLAAEIGEPQRVALPTDDEPPPASLPALSEEALHATAARHPLIASRELRAVSQQHRAEAEQATSYPSFGLGADWVIVGASEMTPRPEDGGKDAIMVGAQMSLPLWQGNYEESSAAARATALSFQAEARSLSDQAHARVEETLSKLRDAGRRTTLYRNTLIPQAEAALSSALGAFVSGRGAVADTLLLQKDLLDLGVDLERARADHARSWAQLEEVVGRAIPAQEDAVAKAQGDTEHDHLPDAVDSRTRAQP